MWEATNIRPQDGDKIIAIYGEETIIGKITIEPIWFNSTNKQETIALVERFGLPDTPLDDFRLWTPYPEGGSRE